MPSSLKIHDVLEKNTFMFGYAICGECVLCFHLQGNVVFSIFLHSKDTPTFSNNYVPLRVGCRGKNSLRWTDGVYHLDFLCTKSWTSDVGCGVVSKKCFPVKGIESDCILLACY